ncbi:MAG: hypothetical protein O2894_10560 [Planctomycetota bacterium]|nr:hypothetical protein [Planctomycetota bacterium]
MRKIVAILLFLTLSLAACGQSDPWEQGFANRVCPVQGGEIDTSNPLLVVNYEGEKIGFCCAGCPEAFERSPEEYMNELRSHPAAYGYRK